MLNECSKIEIPITCQYGSFNLTIAPSSKRDRMYVNTAPATGELMYQLVESSSYEYEFDKVGDHMFQFAQENEIVAYSNLARHHDMGSISTGIYVGILTLPVIELHEGVSVGEVKLEIRSVKSDYETDYRQMLDDIAEYYTDLVLMQGSLVKQQLEVDPDCSSETLYQKYSFIRSMIDSEAFHEAIHKIISNPVRKWTDTVIQKNVTSVRKFTRKNIRQMATCHDRVPLGEDIRKGMPGYLHSVPRMIDVHYKEDTTDNQENQFVKFALRSFLFFCQDLREKKNASERLKCEVSATIEQLSSILEMQFFRQVDMPTHLNLNSPVLQRKEGYREVLQVWLMFDMAARLNWSGGNNVYEGGKKNVATLYEYWLFFKLQELISEFFHLDETDKYKLVKQDADNIDLNIVQGRTTILHGKSDSSMRRLNISLYYNRTFSKVPEWNDPIHKAGSWTMSMRPDYTLSIWPGDISESEAEAQELITHIHFDAKYRLNKVILEDNSNINAELSTEKEQQELGIYKRADLLKMHAYKDAIRRTGGAYVLYPGTENKDIKGFHEIIPGLGAFSVRPGHWNEDSIYLRTFLSEVKAHMFDRTSEREKLSYYQYDVYREKNPSVLMENLPEPVSENRDFLPDETSVIVAYYKHGEHLDWILDNHRYNMRAGEDKGSVRLDSNIINAKYLLLHNGKDVTHFIRICKGGPKVFTRSQLIDKGYPQYFKWLEDEHGQQVRVNDTKREQQEAFRVYLVFELFKSNDVEKELRRYRWNLQNIVPMKYKTKPFVTILSALIKKSVAGG